MSLDELSQHVHGCDFDHAPVDWQRMIQNMVSKGVKFSL
jgi:hypothetical protein